jgi:hypothetical protein
MTLFPSSGTLQMRRDSSTLIVLDETWSTPSVGLAITRCRRILPFKITLPEQADFYAELVNHPKVLKVVALSGGYSRQEGNDRAQAKRKLNETNLWPRNSSQTDFHSRPLFVLDMSLISS